MRSLSLFLVLVREACADMSPFQDRYLQGSFSQVGSSSLRSDHGSYPSSSSFSGRAKGDACLARAASMRSRRVAEGIVASCLTGTVGFASSAFGRIEAATFAAPVSDVSAAISIARADSSACVAFRASNVPRHPWAGTLGASENARRAASYARRAASLMFDSSYALMGASCLVGGTALTRPLRRACSGRTAWSGRRSSSASSCRATARTSATCSPGAVRDRRWGNSGAAGSG